MSEQDQYDEQRDTPNVSPEDGRIEVREPLPTAPALELVREISEMENE